MTGYGGVGGHRAALVDVWLGVNDGVAALGMRIIAA